MTNEEFVERCNDTITEPCKNENYLRLGLESEVGEVAGVIKKYLRGDYDIDEFRKRMFSELGDCLWYEAMLKKYYYPHWGTEHKSAEKDLDVDDLILHYFQLGWTSLFYFFDYKECQEVVIEKLKNRKEKGTIKGDGEGVR
jgi:hypothetical protein